jgi:hypothetical protein
MIFTADAKVPSVKLRANLAGLYDRMSEAITASANMAASMIETLGQIDIAEAGKFGMRWISGLHVKADGAMMNMRISMTHDIPYAGIFEAGGTIKGDPLLWIPLSGTDAEGVQASDYKGGMFSGKSKSGTPLLFSIADKLPKYFGTESVTIPKTFHLREIQMSVMKNYRQLFDTEFRKLYNG